MDFIHTHYLNEIAAKYLIRFDAGEEVILGRFQFSQTGITVTGTGLNFACSYDEVLRNSI